MNGTQVPGKETVRTTPLPHTSGSVSNISPYQLSCEECKKRGVACGGVWRFHSQHGKYILQCRTCRLKKRACPFRRFEDDDNPPTNPKKREDATRRGKRRRESSVISIEDSEESSEESQVAGPSSHRKKKVKVKAGDGWDELKDTLLTARKRKVEIETEAEIELAKVNCIIGKAERDLTLKM